MGCSVCERSRLGGRSEFRIDAFLDRIVLCRIEVASF